MVSRKNFGGDTLFFVENTLFLGKILCFEKKYSDFILQFRLPNEIKVDVNIISRLKCQY